MLMRHVGVVTESSNVPLRQLTRAAAAVQKQVTRDFGPIWGIHATVSAFGSLDDVPIDYWPILIQDDIGQDGAAGVHEDDQGQPFALVEASGTWSLTLSHETLEMLADPSGNRLVAGQAPAVAQGQGRVEFLVEVCDPSEDGAFAYHVNGITVSDFYTPHYFDPESSTGARYSFTGAITKPREVLRGGYLSWHEPVSNHWFQEQFFDATPVLKDLGELARRDGESLRSAINKVTMEAYDHATIPRNRRRLVARQEESVEASCASRAKRLQSRIEAIRKGTWPPTTKPNGKSARSGSARKSAR
jgi:hypothetical protein